MWIVIFACTNSLSKFIYICHNFEKNYIKEIKSDFESFYNIVTLVAKFLKISLMSLKGITLVLKCILFRYDFSFSRCSNLKTAFFLFNTWKKLFIPYYIKWKVSVYIMYKCYLHNINHHHQIILNKKTI